MQHFAGIIFALLITSCVIAYRPAEEVNNPSVVSVELLKPCEQKCSAYAQPHAQALIVFVDTLCLMHCELKHSVPKRRID